MKFFQEKILCKSLFAFEKKKTLTDLKIIFLVKEQIQVKDELIYFLKTHFVILKTAQVAEEVASKGKTLTVDHTELNELMQSCMNYSPEHRPTFKEITMSLSKLPNGDTSPQTKSPPSVTLNEEETSTN